ncbi:hypothetical protein [Prosthecochloris sp. HL-130-GSB]|jgi:hypothetical protein|uniref:hypothetical protein n=1 Tax=Prosthecochloris sp. HL-130-GSB TaxID=1974213 RepID=UPI0012F48D29|nr:hypothetical protein [Prosthecochloris sp. HL-130-GSB]MBO8093361.1 hypothetical protein [Prosthecochloris sp.]
MMKPTRSMSAEEHWPVGSVLFAVTAGRIINGGESVTCFRIREFCLRSVTLNIRIG